MPFGGMISMVNHDRRALEDPGNSTYTADATYESGYYATAQALFFPMALPATAVLGDGDTAYVTAELAYDPSVVWAPAVDERLGELNKSGVNPRISIVRTSGGAMVARLTDANGTAHDTPAYTLPGTGRNVYGASVKRYISGGLTLIDVTLRDITAGVDRETLVGSAITGADTTLSFNKAQIGYSTTFGKGGTGEARFGVLKCAFSSAVVLTTGTAWSSADVDATNPRIIWSSGTPQVTAAGLLTVYDTTASGDGWPTTTTVMSHRLPTGDSTPLGWTPSTGLTHYTTVDDPFGSYDGTTYVSASAAAADEYSVPGLGLVGKHVLAVGVFMRQVVSVTTDPVAALDIGGAVSATHAAGAVTKVLYYWWDKEPALAVVTPKRRHWVNVA